MTSYHDRFLAQQKRNPIFRFWFWWETRKLKRGLAVSHHGADVPQHPEPVQPPAGVSWNEWDAARPCPPRSSHNFSEVREHPGYLSQCCSADVRTECGEPDFPEMEPAEYAVATRWFVCTACNEPCNVTERPR